MNLLSVSSGDWLSPCNLGDLRLLLNLLSPSFLLLLLSLSPFFWVVLCIFLEASFSGLNDILLLCFILMQIQIWPTMLCGTLQLQVAALILENTFTSILDMAGVLLPFLKWFIGGSGSKGPKLLNFLVRSPWNTIDVVGEVRILSYCSYVLTIDEP